MQLNYKAFLTMAARSGNEIRNSTLIHFSCFSGEKPKKSIEEADYETQVHHIATSTFFPCSLHLLSGARG
jgi:hypothetical protein